MADILNKARLEEVCLEIFHDPTLVESIVINTYTNVSDYTLYEVDRVILGSNYHFRVTDPLTGNIESMTEAVQKVGQGTFGEVFADHTKHRIYKIIRTPIADQEKKFQETIRETIIQIILQNIRYTFNGKQIPCAPQIYGFYKYRSSTPDHTGFVIEMESMYQPANSTWALINFPNTFYSFVNIIKAIKDTGILYNHCDVKLNNMMYDFEGNLRLIDFGFSSIHFTFQDTGGVFEIQTANCAWYHADMVANPLHPAPSPPGYYLEKDVIHFLLTSWSAFGVQLQRGSLQSFQFLINLLRYYGLSDGTKTLLNVEKPRNDPTTFHWSYNFNTKTRRFLHDQAQNTLQLLHPDTILSSATSGTVYPPNKTHRRVLLNTINLVIQRNAILQFAPLFAQLDKAYHPDVFAMAIEHENPMFVQIMINNGVDPNGLIKNVPPILYTLLRLKDKPSTSQIIRVLIGGGADINQIVPQNGLPILYFILGMPDANLRNKVLRIILQYNPDLEYRTTDGKKAIDLARDTGDSLTIGIIQTAIQTAQRYAPPPSAPRSIPGGRRKVQNRSKTKKQKRPQKKQKKRQTRK